MSDLISREEAIEAVHGIRVKTEGSSDFMYNVGLGSAEQILTEIPSAEEPLDIFAQMYRAERESLPSAEALSKADTTENPKCDLISRAEVNKAISRYCRHFNTELPTLYKLVNELPSADAVSREVYDTVCEEYNRLVHNAICVKLCDENCEYEKGKTCYHAREHYLIDRELPSADRPTIVRCKDCDNRHTDDCPMYHEEWYEIDEGDGFVDNNFTVHDYSQDDGFCSWAKMKGGDE